MPKPRKPVRPVSVRRAAELAEYRKRRRRYLKEHPECECCLGAVSDGTRMKVNKSEDIHHTRGRWGKLLNMECYWLAVCRWHHRLIGEYPDLARDMGWLCEKGKWGVLT